MAILGLDRRKIWRYNDIWSSKTEAHLRSAAPQIIFILGGFTMEDSNDKVYGILSYIGILVLVPLLAGKTQFAKFHANQGLVLFIADIIFAVIINISVFVLSLIPFVGAAIGGIISGVFGLGIFILMIMGIVNAVNGEMKPLPIIGGIKLIK